MTLTLLAIYVLTIVVLSFLYKKKEGQSGFIIGNRKVGFLGTTLSQLVSITDGTGIVIMFMLSAMFGYGILFVLAGVIVGCILIALISKRIRKLAGDNHYITISDFLKHRYGKATERFAAFLIVTATLLATAGQLHICGKILSELIHIPAAWGVLLTALTVAGYMWIGGYMTVVITDVFQGFLILGFITVSLTFFYVPDMNTLQTQLSAVNNETGWGLFLFITAVYLTYISTWERIFSAKNEKVAVKASYTNIFLNILLVGGIHSLGIAVHQMMPDIPPDQLVYRLFTNNELLPGFGAMLGVTAIALAMSSLDSKTYTVGTNLISNLLGIHPEEDQKRFIFLLRGFTMISFVALSLIAIFIPDFVQYMINVTSLYGFFASIFLIGLFYTPRDQKRFDLLTSIVIGIGMIVWSTMFFTGMFIGFMPNVIPIGIVGVLMVFSIILDQLGHFLHDRKMEKIS